MSIRVRLRPMARSAVYKPPLLPLATGELTTLLKPEGSVFGTATKLFYETADFPVPAYLRTIDLDTLAKHTVYTHAVNRFRHWQGYYSDALGKYVLCGEYPPTSGDIMTVDVPTDTVNWINLASDEFIAIKEWGGYLYVGAVKTVPAHPDSGGAIWRCPIANILNVGSWSKVYTHPSEWGMDNAHLFGSKLVFLASSYNGDIDILATENGTSYSVIKQITGQHACQEFPCLFGSYYAFPYLDGSRHIHIVYSADFSSWTDWDTGITLPAGYGTYIACLMPMGTDRLLIGAAYGTWALHGTMTGVLYETQDLLSVTKVADLNGSPLQQQTTYTSGVMFALLNRPTPADSGGKILVIKPRRWRSAGEDFRVLEGATQRSMYIEQVGALPLIWAKVPSVGAGGTVTLYVYYGNPDVASVSDGDATFMFFDDFEGDLSKWGIAGTPTIVDDTTGNHVCELESGDIINTHYNDAAWINYELKFRYQHKAVGANGPRLAARQRCKTVPETRFGSIQNEIGSALRNYWWLNEYYSGAIHVLNTDGATYPLNSWWKLAGRMIGVAYTALRNGEAWMSGVLTNANYGGIEFLTWDAGGRCWVDDVIVSKLASPEPSVSVGSEEPGAWTINGDTYKYRRQVTIDNTGGGALSDYQILIRFPAI